VSASLHASSHFLWRGDTLSENDPTIGASVTVATKPGLYFAYGLHTVDFGADGSKGERQGLNMFTLGYGKTLASGLSLGLGAVKCQFVGANDVNDLSFGEVFVNAGWKGFHAKVLRNVDGARGNVSRLDEGDVYGLVGYTHAFGKFSAGAAVGHHWYDDAAADDGVSDATVHVGYAHDEHLSFRATYLVGGKTPTGDDWNTTKLVLGVTYAF
jgi:hypothetical protein